MAILYEELGKSNEILDKIEGIVTKFQTKLGNIANEVCNFKRSRKIE